jgi:hypothetical protein
MRASMVKFAFLCSTPQHTQRVSLGYPTYSFPYPGEDNSMAELLLPFSVDMQNRRLNHRVCRVLMWT